MRRQDALAVALAVLGGAIVSMLPGVRALPWAGVLGMMWFQAVLLVNATNGDWW